MKSTHRISLVVRIFFLSLVFFTFEHTCPASAEPAGNGRIQFEHTSYDLGTVSQFTTVTHEFVFQNTGDATLTVGSVQAPCSCTATLLSSDSLAPGETGVLQVSYSPGGRSGITTTSLFLYTNDPDNSEVLIEITAYVRPLFLIEPNPIVFDVGAGEKEKRIRFFPLDDGAPRITDVSTSTEQLSAAIVASDEEHAAERTDGTVLVEVHLEDMNIKTPRKELLSVHIESPPGAEFGVQMILDRVSHVFIEPPVAALGTIKKGARTERVVRITSDGVIDVRALTAKAKPEFIEVNLMEAASSKEGKCKIEINRSATPGFVNGEVIFTNGNDGPTVATLAVFGLIKD